MVLWLSVVACREPGPRPHPRDTDPGETGDPIVPTGETAASAPTADTGAPTTTAETAAPFDCGALPAGPRPFVSGNVITTEEDFDFDATGLLLAQNYYTIKGTDRYGNVQIVATGLTGDAAGIRVLPTGDFVYASPDDGRLVGVSRATGASRTLVSGLRFPNSLEVGTDEELFLAEYWLDGRIIWFDTATEEAGEVGRLDYANGLTLSMDEQVLYVASTTGYWSGATTISAWDRQSDGRFGGARREVATLPNVATSLATDVCDNLYAVAYTDGRVFRYSPATGASAQIADLSGVGGGFSAVRFSPGLGGFSTTSLYVTNRYHLYEVDLGVEGRHVLR